MKFFQRPFWLIAVSLFHPVLLQAAGVPTDGAAIVIGKRYSIESKALGETRKFIVHTPGGYEFSNEPYPLVILLDGTENIQHISASIDFLANNGVIQPMIVVGIENIDRQRDFTPPLTRATRESHPDGEIGGAPKFLSFIADELIPHLDRTYRTRPTRILIGHSYGGLFTSYALLHRPELFKAYFALSPSLWWDDQSLPKSAEQFVTDHPTLDVAVYMTMGNEGGHMVSGAQKFAGALAGSQKIGVSFQRWPEETHGSVVMRSVYEGMKWLYDFYYFQDPIRTYFDSGTQAFDKHFEEISKSLGYEVKPPERLYMSVHEWLFHTEKFQEDLPVLQRAATLYPESTGPHLELGKLHLKLNDTDSAKAEFKRTLQLFPGSSQAREELEKLGVDVRALVGDTTIAPATLRAYVGEYRYADETSIVTLEDGKLFVSFQDKKLELHPRARNSFYLMYEDREYTFQQQGAGKAGSVKIDIPYFSYTSQRVR